jgi:hypothetical protein
VNAMMTLVIVYIVNMENMEVSANSIVVTVRMIIVIYIDVLKDVNPDILNTRLQIFTFVKTVQRIVKNVITMLFVGYATMAFI